ncbi:Signal recognition particle core component [Blyttiomyces sp. JEL0837]|nr:Signal recognition particle core component [Blyttiomyces sp. JEL0837]
MDITPLFNDINRLLADDDHASVLTACDKILKHSKNDLDALNIKVIALIKLDRFEDAVHVLDKAPSALQEELAYEKAYCLHRLQRNEECLKLIAHIRSQVGNIVWNELDSLEMQTLYKMEEYAKAADLAANVYDHSDENDFYYGEILANLTAAWTGCAYTGQSFNRKDDVNENSAVTYELPYNLACFYIAEGELSQAEKMLAIAKDRCKNILMDDFDEGLQSELAIIIAQLAFVHQMQGKKLLAQESFKALEEMNLSDQALRLILQNNGLVYADDKSLAEEAKKLKALMTPAAFKKLNGTQRNALSVNNAILGMLLKKHSSARDHAKKTLKVDPTNDMAMLILASLHQLEGKNAPRVTADLRDYCAKSPASISLRLALVQQLLSQGSVSAAIQILEEFVNANPQNRGMLPGVVSLLMWLQAYVGDMDGALKLLERATEHWKSAGKAASKTNKGTLSDVAMKRRVAEYKFHARKYREAAQNFEELVKADSSDLHSIAGLIMSLAGFNLASAEQLAERLPSVGELIDHKDVDPRDIDVNALESMFGAKAAKQDTVLNPSAVGRAKKHRKKKRLPKNHDPNVKPDPERWLPKRERSAFKKKNQPKNAALKGAQGTAVAGGGLGGTGSARIAGRVAPKNLVPEAVAEVVETPVPAVSKSNKKKKGKK